MPKTQHDLRCFCIHRPLLGTYGVDERGRLYIHVRIWKQRRIFGEMIVTGGSVKLRCRECRRWHTVIVKGNQSANLSPNTDKLPDAITE